MVQGCREEQPQKTSKASMATAWPRTPKGTVHCECNAAVVSQRTSALNHSNNANDHCMKLQITYVMYQTILARCEADQVRPPLVHCTSQWRSLQKIGNRLEVYFSSLFLIQPQWRYEASIALPGLSRVDASLALTTRTVSL